jgi:VWFA-related protein
MKRALYGTPRASSHIRAAPNALWKAGLQCTGPIPRPAQGKLQAAESEGAVRRNSFNPRSSRFLFVPALLLCSANFSPLRAQSSSKAPDVKPSTSIDLSTLGYRVPSRLDRLTEDEPAVSLDFVDADHVLLTFNRKKLWQRLPGCPPEHDDRIMHAVILELPSGNVQAESDWYLHDRRRYLWPLGPGKFLLRKLNDLYEIDSSLHEKLLLSSPKDLVWVTVTPDASQIVIETPAGQDIKTQSSSPSRPEPKFVAQFLNAKTLALQKTIALSEVTNLTATSAGYADFVHKGEIWLVRFGPVPAKRRNLARVRSRMVPNILYASNNSLLIGRCPTPSCDYSVSAFTVTGHRLWQQHWPRYRFFPAVANTDDTSRFGVSTLRLAETAPPTPANASIDLDDAFQPEAAERDVFQQEVQVLDTATGDSILALPVNPAMMSGQNFSLSGDGRRLAVIRGASLDLFDLPSPTSEELAKFSAFKSDVPDLYDLAAKADPTKPESADADATPAESNGAPPVLQPSETIAPSSNDSTNPPTQPDAAQPMATIKVSAKAVAVDVVVTDSKGHPIKGLHPQDFQVTEDGKAQDVRSFREFSDGQATEGQGKGDEEKVTAGTSSASPKPEKPPANVFTNKSHAPEIGAVTLVLFDMLNTPSQDQSYARQQLIKFLRSKPKNLQFALCTLNAGTDPHLRLIQGFTPDETLLLAAAKGRRSAPRDPRWQTSAAGTSSAVDIVGDLAQGGPMSGFQGLSAALQQTQAEQQVTDTNDRSAITLDSMMLLARYLSGIPGRKNVVWLSGSFPISITATTNSGDLSLDNPNYSYKIKRVTNLLAESQIAVYPVDVRGLVGSGVGADTGGGMGGPTNMSPQDFSAGSVIAPASVIPQDMQALAQQAAERDTLLQFATATGGKAFFNTNGVGEAIATAADQGSNYYTIYYSPANKNYDGRFRKIKVQLAEKGYSLHYRQGYYADDTRNSAKDAELARRSRAVAMQHGSPLSHQLTFSVKVVPVGGKQRVDRAKLGELLVASTKAPALPVQIEAQHYYIDYSFDGSELRFMPLENASYRNTLVLMVTSFDREGKMLTGISNLGTRDLQGAAYEKVVAGEFGVQQEVDVPVDAVSLRLGIQDQMSNRLGTVDIPLPLPPDPAVLRQAKNPLPQIEPD